MKVKKWFKKRKLEKMMIKRNEAISDINCLESDLYSYNENIKGFAVSTIGMVACLFVWAIVQLFNLDVERWLEQVVLFLK